MTGALVILAAMVVIGALLYVTDVTYFRHHHGVTESKEESEKGNTSTKDPNPTEEDICCGQHIVCEKTNLTINDAEIVYYDDEELDRFVGRESHSYTDEETEEFRDILLTLLPQDVAGWAKSIRLRRIELPAEVKDELLMLVTELRES